MIQQAVDHKVTRFDPPEDSGEFSVLTFQPGFREAVGESLRNDTAVEIPLDELRPPSQGPYAQFCEQALSGCPLSMDLSLLNGRRLSLSLNWAVHDGSATVAVRATDITEQTRSEEMDAARKAQREIDRIVQQSEAERQLRDSEERYRASFEQAAV